jgi:hypothetical protein
MELRLASGRGSHGMKFTIIHGETTKTKSMSDYSYGVRAGRKTLPPHRLALYTSKGARFRTPYVAERMNKTWEQVVEDIYRKGFQGLAPIYRIKVDDDLWTPLHAPMVWLANQTAAEALDRICAINGTRWRFDEEGTFIYEQDDLDDSVTTITDDEIESFNYQFSTFEYLNWVDAKGGSDNNISSTAAYGNSVASDGIRYELIEDSGLKNTDEATRKARAKLYGSMADVEGGSLVTFFPRLDISPRDLIYIHSDVAGTDKTYYVKDVSKMFNIESREISTEFTLKSQETELLSDIAEYYDGGVVY